MLIVSRVVAATVIDGGGYGNSGWLCIVAAVLLDLPLAIIVDRRRAGRTGDAGIAARAGCLALACVAVFEIAAVMRLTINSISYSEMQNMNVNLIMFITLAGCYYAIGKNGAGVCNAARVLTYIFFMVFAVIFLAQIKRLEPMWLMPLFGPGVRPIINGTIAMAGYLAAAPMIHSLAQRGESRKTSCVASLIVSALIAAVLCALRGMMAPALANTQLTRFLQLDILISNGRQPLSLQLPVLVALHAGFIVSIAGYALAAAGNIQRCFGGLGGRACAAAALIAAAALCMAGLAESDGALLAADWKFAITAAALMTIIISEAPKKRAAVGKDLGAEV